MYEVIYTGQFKKSLKLCVRRGLDVNVFKTVLDILQVKGQLPAEYLPHKSYDFAAKVLTFPEVHKLLGTYHHTE